MLPTPTASITVPTTRQPITLDLPYQPSINIELTRLWLSGKSQNTIRAYLKDLLAFWLVTDYKPLNQVTFDDLIEYQLSIGDLKPASRKRKLSTIKSLLTFGNRVMGQVFSGNVGAALKLPRANKWASETFLSEQEVWSMILLEPSPRNKLLLQFLYTTGMRRSEAAAVRWGHLTPRTVKGVAAGQVVVKFGKGELTRSILLDPSTWKLLQQMRPADAAESDPVWVSRQTKENGDRALTTDQMYHIVRQAAKRAGITRHIGPHLLRHACATHMLDHHAPIQLVRQVLGHLSFDNTIWYLDVNPNESPGQFLKLPLNA